MIRSRSLLVAVAAAFCAAANVSAQAVDLTFNYRTSASPAVVDVAPNGPINLPPIAVGSSSSATLVITNRGTALTYTLASAGVSNSAFKASAAGTVTMPPGGAGVVSVTFSPALRGPVTDTLSLVFSTSSGQTVVFTFFLSANGLSADLSTSYLLPGGNQTAVANGSAILFPSTLVQQPTVATFIVANRGNADGTLRSVTVSGDAFTVAGLPLLPAVVELGKDIRFTVQFKPVALGVARGSLRVDLSDGVRTFSLEGTGTGASLSYEINLDGNFVRVAPGGAIAMPATQVAGRRTAAMRIRNEGTSEGRITAITASGDAFRTQDVTPLPAAIPPEGTLNFTLVFAPRDSGAATGRLLINETVFDLTGEGIGPRLTFATEVGGAVTTVPDTNLIILPNTTVGTRLAARMIIRNEGNAAATISGVSISGAPFSVTDLPPFPATVAQGQALTLTLAFIPSAVGTVNGTLQVDERTFTVRGSAGAPPALPRVSIDNLSDTAESLQQPAVGLTIASAYPTEITGKLNLGFAGAQDSGGVDDGSIQFASGGRSVDFRIPANSREAIFGDSAKTMQFQTGTVAGTITLSPTFTVGSADVTPTPAPSRSVVIASQPPRIRSLQIGTRSGTSFEILITGYSSTRALNQIALQFTAAPGANLTTTTLNVNADSAFSTWYQGAASRPFGSQFTASLTINVTGDLAAVQSVSVTGSNSKGPSNSMSVNLR